MYEPLGFCTLAMLKYNFARRSLVGQNESGLYDVGFLGQPNTGLSRCRSCKVECKQNDPREYTFVLFGYE
ncbi:hypothetical protein T09_8375 [Trichinella sp. T9]|nr:hypothetical protein T09_8375 [Trichinella sp. T9]